MMKGARGTATLIRRRAMGVSYERLCDIPNWPTPTV